MSHKRIHPVDLMNQRTADTCILDVRTLAEVNAAGLPDCLHIPLHELTPERLQAELDKSDKTVRASTYYAKRVAAPRWPLML